MRFRQLQILSNTLHEYQARCGLSGMVRAIRSKFNDTHPLAPLKKDRGFNVRLRTKDLEVYAQVFDNYQYSYRPAKPVNCIVDAGANIGCSAVFFARSFPGANIICIEAAKENYELLTRNCTAFPNITCLHAALWTMEGQVDVVDVGLGEWAFRVRQLTPIPGEVPSNGKRVQAVTLREIMRTYSLNSIDILKVDIEGGEREVFAEGPELLEKVNVLAVECHDKWVPGCSRSVMEATRNFAFEWMQGETMFFCREGWLPVGFHESRYRKIRPH